MFALLCGNLGELLHHQIQVVDLVAEFLLKGFQDVVELSAGDVGGLTEGGLVGELLEGLGELYLVGEVLNALGFGVETGGADEADESQ